MYSIAHYGAQVTPTYTSFPPRIVVRVHPFAKLRAGSEQIHPDRIHRERIHRERGKLQRESITPFKRPFTIQLLVSELMTYISYEY